MSLTLLRQDPVLSAFKMTISIAVLMGLMLRLVLSQLPADLGRAAPAELDPAAQVLSGALVLVWFFLLVTSGFWMRCRRLDLALPLSSRRLWFARNLMVAAGWLLPLSLFTVIVALRLETGGGIALDGAVLSWGAHQAAWLLLLTAALQLPGRGLQQQRIDAWYLIYSIVIAAATLLTIMLTPPTPTFILAPLAATLLLQAYLAWRLPGSLTLAPRDAEEAADGDDEVELGPAAPTTDRRPGILPVDSPGAALRLRIRVIGRMVMNNPIHWVFFPSIAFFGWAVAENYHDGKTLMPFLLFILIYAWALLAHALPRLQRFDHLPIPRRFLLPFGLVPFLLLVAAGPVLHGLSDPGNERGSQIRYHDGRLHVPPEFWELAPAGESERVVAPWGESHRPEAKQLVAGWSMAVFNPFTWGEESSERFAAWQVARARAAVYGEPDPSAAAGSWRPDPAVVDCLDSKRWSVGRSLPSPLRDRCQALGAGIVILLGTLFIVLSLPAYRGRGPRRFFILFVPVTGGLLALLATVILLGNNLGWTELEFMEVLLPVLVRGWTEALPAGLPTALLWALDLLLLTGGYLLVLRLFRAIELPLPRRTFLVEYES